MSDKEKKKTKIDEANEKRTKAKSGVIGAAFGAIGAIVVGLLS